MEGGNDAAIAATLESVMRALAPSFRGPLNIRKDDFTLLHGTPQGQRYTLTQTVMTPALYGLKSYPIPITVLELDINQGKDNSRMMATFYSSVDCSGVDVILGELADNINLPYLSRIYVGPA